MKKIIALLLALVMVLSLAACAGPADDTTTTTSGTTAGDELEPATVVWALPIDEMEGSDDVEAAFNDLLSEALPNTTVEFVWVGNYDNCLAATNMMLAGEERMDLMWSGWMYSQLQDVNDGNYLPLSDLVDKYAPNIKEEMSIWANDYASCTIDDELYMIPSIQPNSGVGSSKIEIKADALEYFNVEELCKELHASSKTTDRVYELVEEGIQNMIDAGKLTVGDNAWCFDGWALMYLGARGYARVCKSNAITWVYDPDAAEPTVMHFYETPGVRKALSVLEEWRNKGWFTESEMAGDRREDVYVPFWVNPDLNTMWTDLTEDYGVQYSADSDEYFVLCETYEQLYKPAASFSYATAMVVPFTAEEPERAMMVLDLLHDDEAGSVGNRLYNLLAYGFEEGSDYATEYGWANYTVTEDADGQDLVDNSILEGGNWNHYVNNWVLANTYKSLHDGSALTTAGAKEAGMKYWTEDYPKLKESLVSGKFVDTTPITNDLTACDTIMLEYYERIKWGHEDLLDEMLEKMGKNYDNVVAHLNTYLK